MAATGNVASGFAIGAKNAVGIASRDGLYLNMIGCRGDGRPVFGLEAVFLHTPSLFQNQIRCQDRVRLFFSCLTLNLQLHTFILYLTKSVFWKWLLSVSRIGFSAVAGLKAASLIEKETPA
jgi:hypothetical protein